MSAIPDEVDIIICGAGGAGCYIAAQVAKSRPDLSILLLEQGPDNRAADRLANPLDSLFWLFKENPYIKYLYSEPQAEINGRAARIPVGNVLGGGTSINTLMYNTAAKSDYDDWNQPGWSWEDLKGFVEETINFNVPSADKRPHGSDGGFEVSLGGHVMDWEEDFRAACQDAVEGLKSVEYLTTYWTESSHAVGRHPKLISSKGIRSNVADAFLHSTKLSNLHVLTTFRVSRVIIEDGIAEAVEVEAVGKALGYQPRRIIKARKMVIVAGGTLGSPCILERSGVGDPKVLSLAGVEVKVDLPGVGAELNDHQLTCCSYHSSKEGLFDDYARGMEPVKSSVDGQWKRSGSGIAATNGFDFGYKLRPNDKEIDNFGQDFKRYWADIGYDKPDKPLYSCVIIPYFYSYNMRPSSGNYFCFGGFHNYPKSRGSVHIRSPDPSTPPTIDAGLLKDPIDMAPHVWHYKICREIARRLPFYRGEEAGSHPPFSPQSAARLISPSEPYQIPTDKIPYSEEDDKVIENWVRDTVATAYHGVSTCPMRPREDQGVLDPRLNVYGVRRLKVVDLSICPLNIGANTTSVVLLIAAKASQLILQDLTGDSDQ